ncbi:serine hydrolase domain-containing protein [Cognatilysobacter tabacisoli]|uniref:serine hydrolase domain-containing protein n=1 Tax=Cognatilysobacter tabacisoli TaxID=2315424 RepID=UPI000E6B2A4D
MPGNDRRSALAAGRRVVIAVLMLATFSAAGRPVATGLQPRIAQALAAEGITGAVWGLDDGSSTTFGAAGLAAAGRPMTPDARVHVGSIAKAVLATGVLRLATEGRLDLDARVDAVVPGVAFDNPWHATHPVRVRHLLDHTAGLDDMRLSQLFSLQARADLPLAEALAVGRPLRVRSRPGSRFSYSNTGYALLGQLIEVVTGQRYERYLEHALLAPLCATARSRTPRRSAPRPTRGWRWATSKAARRMRRCRSACARPRSSPPRPPTCCASRASSSATGASTAPRSSSPR